MNKYILTIAIILIGICKMHGQNSLETNLIGNWKVKSVEILNISEDHGDPKKLEMLKKLLLKSKFEFKVDRHINFKIEMKDMEVKNELWRFNSFKDVIIVTEEKNKNSILMEIKVIVEKDKTSFILLESPFKLEVIKE